MTEHEPVAKKAKLTQPQDDDDSFEVVPSGAGNADEDFNVDDLMKGNSGYKGENDGLEDIKIVCKDCKVEFVFSVREQKFYNWKNFTNTPQRCAKCKKKKAARDRKNDNRKNRKNICFAFKKGKCSRGSNCRFKHESRRDNDGGFDERPPAADRRDPSAVVDTMVGRPDPNVDPASIPKGVCFDFRKGTCARGDACRFAHTFDNAKYAASNAEDAAKKAQKDIKPEDIPKGVCFDFRKGTCARGDACRFAHTYDDAKYAASNAEDAAKKAKKDIKPEDIPKGVCFDFRKGTCDRGNACRFAHTE